MLVIPWFNTMRCNFESDMILMLYMDMVCGCSADVENYIVNRSFVYDELYVPILITKHIKTIDQ